MAASDGAAPAPAPKRRPDARPSRMVMGIGALAAMSVVTAGMVRYPVTSTEDIAAVDVEAPVVVREKVVHRVRYVQLKRGQKAPPGAKVIRGAQPTPRVVVREVPVRTRTTTTAPTTRRRPVARSRQSGG